LARRIPSSTTSDRRTESVARISRTEFFESPLAREKVLDVHPVQRAKLETAEGRQDVTVQGLGVALVSLASESGGDPGDPARGVRAQRDLRVLDRRHRLARFADLFGQEVFGLLPGVSEESPAPALSVLVVNDPAVSIRALPHAGHVSALAGVRAYGVVSASPA